MVQWLKVSPSKHEASLIPNASRYIKYIPVTHNRVQALLYSRVYEAQLKRCEGHSQRPDMGEFNMHPPVNIVTKYVWPPVIVSTSINRKVGWDFKLELLVLKITYRNLVQSQSKSPKWLGYVGTFSLKLTWLGIIKTTWGREIGVR